MAATHSRTDCPEYSVTPFRGLMRMILGRVSNSTCGPETSTLMDSGLAAVVIFSVRVGACRHGIGVSGCELVYRSADSNRLHTNKFQFVVTPCLLGVGCRPGVPCCIVSTSWSIFAVTQVIVDLSRKN